MLIISVIFSLFLSINLHAQVANNHIEKLEETYSKVQKKIEEKERVFKKAQSDVQKQKINDEISQLKSDLDVIDQQLTSYITGIEATEKKPENKEESFISRQLEDLITPALLGLKRISERPRMIEALRAEIDELKGTISEYEGGIEQATKLKKELPKVKIIKKKIEYLEDQNQLLKLTLVDKERRLDQLLSQNKSLFESSKQLLEIFFKTKGKHLFFSLLSLIIIFWSLIYLRRKIFSTNFFTKRLSDWQKALYLSYNILAFIVSVLSALACLYLLHDWVLVTLFIILISAVLWSSKQFIPQFLKEARLIMNLGTIKENELLLHQGILWKVRKIGLQTILVNSKLEHGIIRVPLHKIADESTHAFSDDVELFPTEKGDWISHSEGQAQVILQTPSVVKLKLITDKIITIKTSDFLQMGFTNYSKGHAVDVVFGLDYQDQKDICETIPKNLKEHLSLCAKELEYHQNIVKIVVEFHSAGESCLNILVRFFMNGKSAQFRSSLERFIQKKCVEFCNLNNYSIPFKQLTIHQATDKTESVH